LATQLKARILHLNRATKRVGLTLLPRLVSRAAVDLGAEFAGVEIGEKYDAVPIVRQDDSMGLMFKLPAGDHYGYAHVCVVLIRWPWTGREANIVQRTGQAGRQYGDEHKHPSPQILLVQKPLHAQQLCLRKSAEALLPCLCSFAPWLDS
jgi:hypothetical protein